MDIVKRCEGTGLKMTDQRRVILKVLDEAGDHPSVDDIYNRAKAIDSSISMATVYRNLSLLAELNVIVRREFNFNENFSRYEVNMDHHHHLIDVDSGEVIEFQSEEMEKIKKKIAGELGYDLVECRLELYCKKSK